MHLSGCLFMLIGNYSSDTYDGDTWINANSLYMNSGTPSYLNYTISIYWAMTTISVNNYLYLYFNHFYQSIILLVYL